jgi:hypothetical protein
MFLFEDRVYPFGVSASNRDEQIYRLPLVLSSRSIRLFAGERWEKSDAGMDAADVFAMRICRK